MFITGVTGQPRLRSGRSLRSQKSPPHPETAARRSPRRTGLGYGLSPSPRPSQGNNIFPGGTQITADCEPTKTTQSCISLMYMYLTVCNRTIKKYKIENMLLIYNMYIFLFASMFSEELHSGICSLHKMFCIYIQLQIICNVNNQKFCLLCKVKYHYFGFL